MKAIVCDQFGAPAEVAHVTDVPMPGAPGLGMVAIDVAYATVSHATDLLIRGKYQSQPPLPFVPGTELVGHVAAVGSDVTAFKPGDPVLALSRWGCYAQRVHVSAHTVYPMLKTLDMMTALPLPLSYGTAYAALVWIARLKPSDTILILGAGSGVGLAAVDLATALGVRVIACASTQDKRAVALAHGAELALDPRDDLVKAVKAACPSGASVIFDPVGGEVMETAFKAAAQSAQLISIGFASGRVPQLPLNVMLVKNLTLRGFFFGKYIGWTPSDERARYEADMRELMGALQQLASKQKIQPLISQVYPMGQLTRAIDDLHQGRVTGKIALDLSGA